KILDKEKVVGYAYIGKAPSKTDLFDYLILLNTEFIVAKTKVLIYRENYGGEIGSRRWLKQFIGLKSQDKVIYGKDIIPISGATISTKSMTRAVNSFLQNLQVLIDNDVL
ncbi:MAG: FMN-binding protein, partial [Flavobacteriaceae bacterium]|nr:FMN-binding protein [Flavobacteriaceae bacterium]